MPRPSTALSAPNLQIPPRLGLHSCLLPRPCSMFKPKSSPHNAPIRRLTSRRARPSVACITDFLVSSLVMASFCADHSPRGRRLSTMAVGPSKSDTERWHGRRITSSRPLSSRKRLDCYRPSTGYVGVRCFRIQTIRNRAFPQASEDYDGYGAYRTRPESYGELSSTGRQEGQDSSNLEGDLDTNQHQPPHLLEHDPPKDAPNSFTENDGTSTGAVSADTHLDDQPESLTQSYTVRDDAGSDLEIGPHISVSEPQLARSDTVGDAGEEAGGNTQNPSLGPIAKTDYPSRHLLEITPIEEFINALSDPRKSNQYIFRLYRDLPAPGVVHLPRRIRNTLLRRFADPMNKRWPDARRYLTVVEHMVQANLHLSRSLWTSAIHLAGRAPGRVRKRDLVRAIGIWRQMEQRGNVESDDVVFTVLFDIAVKAGQFTVAERIVEEMTSRGIKFTRFGHVSKIYYHGMIGDADGIRQTYSEFLSAGNIVDTVVLNCLIASFSRVGDFKMVMQLYESMLEAHRDLQKRIGLMDEKSLALMPALTSEMPFYRRRNRELGRQLKMLAAIKDQYPEQHRAIQEALPLSPDTRTFHVLLTHHAYRSGNLKRLMSVLEDMEEVYPIPPRGMVYIILFQGFAWHGGRMKQWSADRLRYTWETYLRALYESKVRYRERFNRQMQKLVWENPFSRAGPTVARLEKPKHPVTHIPTAFYTPLPSANSDGEADMEEPGNTANEDDGDCEIDDDPAGSNDIDVDELFSNPAHSREVEEEMAELDRQIVNGVFLGRRIIIVILRAFGACCEPHEVLDVWLTVERLWHPDERKPLDVQVIKEELEKQLAKAERLSRLRAFRPRRDVDPDD